MLTQIEIDGFKTFKDFKVELAPFQVIVGPNGSGKSNLFDALQLLSRLADTDLLSAFQGLRGDAYELFTKLPDGRTSDKIRIAVEMLVDRKVQDRWGKQAELEYRRLRYELEITSGIDAYGLDGLYVTHESLESIPRDTDQWCRKYGLSASDNWLPKPAKDHVVFITTDKSLQTERPAIHLHVEEYPYEARGKVTFQAELAQGTVLSGVTSVTGFPHAFAAREEMFSFRFLHLNPEALRHPSSIKAPRFLASDGSNLPTTLARMQAEDKFALNGVSRDLANLVPDLTHIDLKKDEVRNEYTIWAEYMDGRSFSSQVLSEGTLQLLALATLKNDQQFRGVLCFEEPETGVHPSYLKNIARLLRGLATDFNDPQQIDESLRQVLVTTHSPAFISLPDVIDVLLFAHMVTRVESWTSGNPPMQITLMVPVVLPDTHPQSKVNDDEDVAVDAYTIDQIKKYLNSERLDEARLKLGTR